MRREARRSSRLLGLGAAALLLAGVPPAGARVGGGDRTISFYHIHTQETLTVTYKKDGKFVPEALKQINHIMRDWRKNQEIAIDPNTIDIIWEMHEELGSKEPVNIICGYRSRATNEMLRRTVGGQASQSQHITGKAVDITFPDVPLKRMRYSAMIRERGGVGYYPTSGVPFVHVDTANVRHWPRMPRDELALLFPSGHSKYEPADGRPITPADVRVARTRNAGLATEMAQFFALREAPKSAVQVAEATPPAPLPAPPRPALAVRPRPPAPETRMAVGAPLPPPEATQPDAQPTVLAAMSSPPPPQLVGAPKLVDRPSQFVAKLPDGDRSRLDMLVQLASIEETALASSASPGPQARTASLVTGSTPVAGPTADAVPPPRPMLASLTPDFPFPKKKAALEPLPAAEAPAAEPSSTEPAHPLGEAAEERAGWLSAPEYDDDHPDEMSYRPFALAPLLTDTPSFDDPALTTMVHPDTAETLELLDEEGTVLPMRFGTGHAQTMTWAQAFSGDAVNLAEIGAPPPAAPSGPRLVERSVKTLPR